MKYRIVVIGIVTLVLSATAQSQYLDNAKDMRRKCCSPEICKMIFLQAYQIDDFIGSDATSSIAKEKKIFSH